MVLNLPAEGLTVEFIARHIRSLALQPVFTTFLFLVSKTHPQLIEKLLGIPLSNKIQSSQWSRIHKYLIAAGLVYHANNLLTRLVLNNFTRDSTWNWDREVVLITGGCGGIGELMVRSLAKRGIKVVVLDLVSPRDPFPENVHVYTTDIASSLAISKAAERIRREVGDPTVLINNAGVAINAPFLETSDGNIQKTFNVNAVAGFLLAQEFLPSMIKQNHGHIVNIASLSSFYVPASLVHYAASKAAVLAFHEGLSQELKWRYRAKKIRTTSVYPMYVRTPLMPLLMDRGSFQDFLLEPSTVADAVVNQVLKCESAQIILPGRYGFVPLIRALPTWLQELMRDMSRNVLSGTR